MDEIDEKKLDGVQERASSSTPPQIERTPVPDHGLQAWLQVLGSFMVFFSVAGAANAFSAYQVFYQGTNYIDASASGIAWIGSTQAALLLALGIVTGPLYDYGYFYPLLWIGTILTILGQLTVGISTTYAEVFLSQAICMGLGGGMVFLPSFSILASYFDKNLEIAVGIAATGSGVGGVVFPILFNRTISTIGFGWTTRALGLIMAGALCIALTVYRTRPQPKQSRRWQDFIDWQALREPASALFLCAMVIASASVNIPAFYIQWYGMDSGIAGVNVTDYLSSIYTAAFACGCLGLNALAQPFGVFNVLSLSVLLSGALCLSLWNMRSAAGLILIDILVGFLNAGISSLPPACYVKLAPSPDLVGTRMGMGYLAMTIGTLVGPPIAGAILDSHGFNGAWLFGSMGSLVGAVLFMVSRGFYTGWGVWVRA